MDVIIWDSPAKLQFYNAEENHHFLNTASEFKAFDKFEAADRIFILAELKWPENVSNQSFYGFELLKKLRLKKITCPIVMCSFLPKDYFLNHSKTIFNLLKLPASHPFVRLPQKDLLHYEFEYPLNEISTEQLEDALHHFLNPVGTLDEILHNLKDKINYDSKAAAAEAFDDIRQIVPKVQYATLDTIKSQFFSDIDKKPKSLSRLVSNYKTTLRNLFPKSQDNIFISKEISAWGALLVDDNPRQRELIKNLLSDRGIQCFTTGSGEEAFALLRKDIRGELESDSGLPFPKNFITVLICDLRLEDDKQNWQPLQGYDILRQVHEQEENYLSFFVLTSKRKAILNNVSKLSRMQIKWYSKEMILHTGNESAFNTFATQIKEDGTAMLDTICSFPRATSWTQPWKNKIEKPYIDFYRVFRLAPDYYVKEQWIANCAVSFIEEAELVRDTRIKHIDKVSNQNFPTVFMSGIKGNPSDHGNMDKFYIKLIGRRIAIGLYLKGWKKEDISDILKFKELKSNSADRQLFSAYLALSTKIEDEIPTYLLVEERKWVETYLGFTLEPRNKSLFYILKKLLEEVSVKLYENNCPAEFADSEIIINNSDSAHTLLSQAYYLSKEFGTIRLLESKMEVLLENDTLQPSIRNNGIDTLWKVLKDG